MGLFPMAQNYPTAVALLVLAGVFSITFTSMAQTLVQILAPVGSARDDRRSLQYCHAGHARR